MIDDRQDTSPPIVTPLFTRLVVGRNLDQDFLLGVGLPRQLPRFSFESPAGAVCPCAPWMVS